ncbi:hypothetical protein CC1G_10625 [Coprinopsis cinerea okayama7|uniref:Uncharacterized protein n=1 Tax=Coprinopsis cinerea (strain Okayama-7 / 130 / ATCC MYA-4618 / FGSC 9003) TaxID=240176 RepID=A8P613_COPC7|nr:hypothetical protein CC1G_10625 [Coprinopsis cinerea okayama7\|eukprot:XP_001839060.1 hypothetical protein CC1G_10625 [Coprinopsis cinerea okayama7\
MLKAIKNSSGEQERRHSRAMRLEYMEKLYAYLKDNTPAESETKDPASLKKRAEMLQFAAFAALGFTLWTRNCEAVQLQVKHFDFAPPPKRASNGAVYPFFVVNLLNRKGWQRKMAKGEHQLNGHTYNIYPKPYSPAIDMYQRLLDWKECYETLLGRPLEPEDHMFPTIGANLAVHPDDPLTSDAIQKRLTKFTKAAELGEGFTTHCFRRGGAQYRFMYAPLGQRWTLARVRWWGGWAQGEHRDTLIRYLLDELWMSEDDHRDALCPFDEDASDSHMGEGRLLQPLTQVDGQRLLERLDAIQLLVTTSQNGSCAVPSVTWPAGYYGQHSMAGLQKAFNTLSLSSFEPSIPTAAVYTAPTPLYNVSYNVYNVANPVSLTGFHQTATFVAPTPRPQPVAGIYQPPIQSPYGLPQVTNHPPNASQLPPEFQYAASVIPQHAADNYTPAFGPTMLHPDRTLATMNNPGPTPTCHQPLTFPSTKNPTRHHYVVPSIHASKKELVWKQVIEDWLSPKPNRASVPLSQWDTSLLADVNQKQKYHIRKVIAEEYIERYHSSDEEFTCAYPEHAIGMTALYKAILAQRQIRGDSKRRARKSRSPSPEQ